jgi:hypothetical protein
MTMSSSEAFGKALILAKLAAAAIQSIGGSIASTNLR